MICDRCRRTAIVYTMSIFSTDEICLECKEAEKSHPLYELACEKELEEVRRGNYRFPGIGTPPDLASPGGP